MKCEFCKQPTHRLIIDVHGKICANCRGLSETGGVQTDHLLTRTSDRVRTQQQKHEGDFILPHTYDSAQGKMVANPDFVNRYPEQLDNYFSQSELEAQGYSKIGKVFDAKRKQHEQNLKDKHDVTYKQDKQKEKAFLKSVEGKK